MKRALLIAIVGAVFLQHGGVRMTAQTPPPGALSYFKGYFGNIDHVVGGVGLSGLGDSTGFATGTIHIGAGGVNAVPATADISAAYLYWLSMETSTDPSSSNGTFDGHPIIGKQIAPTGVAVVQGFRRRWDDERRAELARVSR